MQSSYINILGIGLLLCLSFSSVETLADNNKGKLKVKVLENTSFNECHYSGSVAIEVKYKLKNFADNTDTGLIILEAAQDDAVFYQVISEEVKAGKGSTVLIFDAGECTHDIRISIQ